MPLWDFHYTAGGLSTQQKETLVAHITTLYSSAGMPEFYVQVRFREFTSNTMYVGNQNCSSIEDGDHKFAAIEITHVARTFTSITQERQFLHAVDRILKPVFVDGGWGWEYWVSEVKRDLWKVNGMIPPPTGSSTERRWAEVNKPIPGVAFERL